MKLRRLFAAVVALLVSAGPSAGFGQTGPAHLAPYKIGLTYPLTGPFAANAAAYLPAIDLAVGEINAKGGVKGHPLQIVTEDTQATPAGGIEAMRKLVQVDGVQIVMTIYTNVVLAQVPLADQLRVPTLSPVEVPGVIEKTQFSFAHSSRQVNVLKFMGEYWKAHGLKRVYAFWSNNAQGQASSPLERGIVEGYGGTFGDALVNLTDTDFRGIASRAKEFNPQIVLINMQGSLAETTLLKQLRDVGVTAPVSDPAIFYNSKYWRDAAGPYAEGMYFAGLNVDPVDGGPFMRAYRAKTGYLPDYVAAEEYDMVHFIAYAIGRGGYSGEGIRNALASFKDLPTVFGGKVSMLDDHRTLMTNVNMYQVRGGKLVRLTAPAKT